MQVTGSITAQLIFNCQTLRRWTLQLAELQVSSLDLTSFLHRAVHWLIYIWTHKLQLSFWDLAVSNVRTPLTLSILQWQSPPQSSPHWDPTCLCCFQSFFHYKHGRREEVWKLSHFEATSVKCAERRALQCKEPRATDLLFKDHNCTSCLSRRNLSYSEIRRRAT